MGNTHSNLPVKNCFIRHVIYTAFYTVRISKQAEFGPSAERRNILKFTWYTFKKQNKT